MIISRKYEVIGEIGRGGMGIVYKIRHLTLDAIFALKVLPADFAKDAVLVARFHREARVMAQLRHPNIVRVLDFDQDGEMHYFVMEYVHGQSLSQVLRERGRLPLSEVFAIVRQIGAALAYAHAIPAVVHRDVKPSNILIEEETNRAVVTDFGLAKLTRSAETKHTTGILGTLRYCAPEQLRGDPELDSRADIFSFGILLHELFSGRHPLAGLDDAEVIGRLLFDPGELPVNLGPGVPETLDAFVARAIAKDRDLRYPSIAELLADFEGVAAALPVGQVVLPNEPEERARSVETRLRSSSAVAIPAKSAEARSAGRGGFSLAKAGRRFALIAVVVAAVLTPGILYVRSPSPGPGKGPLNPSSEPTEKQSAIGVMDFTAWAGEPQMDWMRDVIRDNLNSQLSQARNCKVFSKEFIDFKARNLVRDGTYTDIRTATMDVAEQLGITKAVFGRFRLSDEKLYIEAHIVDMETGVRQESDTVEGQQGSFSELQAKLASKLMVRLGLQATATETANVASAPPASSLESYKLLLEAEGGGSTISPPANDGQSLIMGGVAWAQELPAEGTTPEAEIRNLLETYRRAVQSKDLDLVRSAYESLTPAQVAAHVKYFDSARDLSVVIDKVDIALGDDEAAVSYTRKDEFTDVESLQKVKLEVRLTKILVHKDGRWLIAGERK